MDIKFLKRQKWDKLDLPTLHTTISIVRMLRSNLWLADHCGYSKGLYSPKRVEARRDELDGVIEYLTRIVETISNSQKKKGK
jgi:hypothetical protein